MGTGRVMQVALAAALVAAPRVGHASPEAEAAFARGREALGVGKYIEACAAFDEAQHLDPQPTTQFNIALCSEQLGKLATALAIYKDLALHDDNPARRAKHPEKVAELEQRVARLTVVALPAPHGIQIAVDSAIVSGMMANIPIDLGSSTVTITAPGYGTITNQVTVKAEKQLVILNVQMAADSSVETPPPPPHHSPSLRSIVTVTLLSGGGVVLAGGVVLGVLAHSKYGEAKDVCGGSVCDSSADLAKANDLVATARARGNLSTAFVISGAVLVAGGVALWLTEPKPERTSIAIAPSLGGVTVLGKF